MTDIPIIFSGPMVRALLEGRKTMTRRLAWRSETEHKKMAWYADDEPKPEWAKSCIPTQSGGYYPRPSPWQRVKPGDRLWVRESLTRSGGLIQRVADGWSAALWPPEWKQDPRPSIHMPRWASRLTLIVTATKIERLQKIDNADAIAEGCGVNIHHPTPERTREPFPVAQFIELWCSLHGEDAWDANPEVVALAFNVVKANIDAPQVAA